MTGQLPFSSKARKQKVRRGGVLLDKFVHLSFSLLLSIHFCIFFNSCPFRLHWIFFSNVLILLGKF